MQTQTKQRLIGALVIVGIAAIFLPVLFYHPLPGFKKLNLSAEIPAATDNPQKVYDLYVQQGQLSTKPKEVDQDELVPSQPLSEEELRSRAAKTTLISKRMLHAADSVEAPVKSFLKEKEAIQPQKNNTLVQDARDLDRKKVSFQSSSTVPEAWVIQVATFSDKGNALQLVKKLRHMNLDAFSRKINLNGEVIVQVYVGPYIQKDVAKSFQQDLQNQLHLNGVIKKYTIS
ncbi:MAG: hypothetical protein A3F10_01530 [Coxiella sp. RIFCSPHIGHO2_12_FULL_42_15]|nr:MAG: hypothetical protein A3F10_01530 [Coxiella sp. RIFCSPHIGHO2_12_FULL_42_15]